MIKFAVSALALALASTLARAQAPAAPIAAQPVPQFDVKLSTQDAGSLNQICVLAMDAPRDLGTKTAVGQFCLDLLNRIAQAQKTSAQGAAQGVPAPALAPAPAPQGGENK